MEVRARMENYVQIAGTASRERFEEDGVEFDILRSELGLG